MRAVSDRRLLVSAALILVIVLAAAFALAVLAGPAGWALSAGLGEARTIVLQIRLPRAVVAALVGAILATSGLTFQTLLRNPLADPFILGISGGAAAGAAIASAAGLVHSRWAVPLLAFAGALVSTATVFFLGRRHGQIEPVRLLLAGLVLNAFFSAVILFAFSFSRSAELTLALRWMMGSLFGTGWFDAALLAALFVIAFVYLAAVGGDLRLMVFGEDEARAMGVDTEKLKLFSFLAASLITGAAVAMSGIIGFVGLLVPHAIRLVLARDFRLLLPLSALGGAALLLISDVLARTLAAPAELPIGALTAVLGVPFFLVVLRRA